METKQQTIDKLKETLKPRSKPDQRLLKALADIADEIDKIQLEVGDESAAEALEGFHDVAPLVETRDELVNAIAWAFIALGKM